MCSWTRFNYCVMLNAFLVSQLENLGGVFFALVIGFEFQIGGYSIERSPSRQTDGGSGIQQLIREILFIIWGV